MIAALPDSISAPSTYYVGHEHIDLRAAMARGLMISNMPSLLNEATTDIAFMLLLCASRRTSEAKRVVRNGEWIGWVPTQMLGIGMQGKRLAILGMSGIGREFAKRG